MGSTYEIESSGLIKTGRAIENYINLMSGKVNKIGDLNLTDIKRFGYIGYTIKWQGKINNPNIIDLVYKQFKRYNAQYLNEWVIGFQIKIREKG